MYIDEYTECSAYNHMLFRCKFSTCKLRWQTLENLDDYIDHTMHRKLTLQVKTRMTGDIIDVINDVLNIVLEKST